MTSPPAPTGQVTDEHGVSGCIEAVVGSSVDTAPSDVSVKLGDKRHVSLPARALIPIAGGGYACAGRFADLPQTTTDVETSRRPNGTQRDANDPLVVPVIAEALEVGTRHVERVGVRITKTITERVEIVDLPLMEEHIDVDRVVVNRMIEAVPPVRYEGDVMIVPLVDEILVTEKRLMLREELHIRKSAVVAHRPQPVTLRREEALVERVDRDQGADSRDDERQGR